MAKRKAKKAKTVIDPTSQDKIEKLARLLDAFKTQAVEYENYLNNLCIERCNKIEKLYMERLKSIPENIRNMTITQYMELQRKERARETECPRDENAIRMQHERQRMTSERKRTQRKEKKRSISCPASARALSVARHANIPNAPLLNRNASELSLLTPVGKMRKPSMAVTPKFNPNLPVLAPRKPKPGEILMSLSGSPLQNFMDDLPPDKPAAKVTLSLGHGKVITFGEDAEIECDKDFLKTIDEPLKATIQNVQKKLEEILKS